MRTRKDVWNLAADPTDKTLHWYSVAVTAMQARMFDNPISWKFQAGVHGYQGSVYPPLRPGEHLPTPAIQRQYWDYCQHYSWWFLPWHRIYLYLFESMCRDAITAAGGPADWALPYWDYSHPANTPMRTLPIPFRNAQAGAAPNPLYAVRAPGVNTGGVVGIDKQTENTTCLKSPAFSGQAPNGFGGGASPVIQFSHYTGNCENGPHNTMHDAIGGSAGWMGNPDAAALDPIFWLHHANIDRLWVIWANTPPHTPPPDARWNNQTFTFFDNKGKSRSYKVSDVLQTTGPLCDYQYENATNPIVHAAPLLAFSSARFGKQTQPAAAALPIPDQRFEGIHMAIPQTVGLNDTPNIPLGSAATSVTVELNAPAVLPRTEARGMELTAAATPASQHVYLSLQNVTAKAHPIHTYGVYVNLPENTQPSEAPELLAGLIPRFGLVKASQSAGEHGDQGVNLSFDISEIVATLEKNGTWDPAKLRVTFAPEDEPELTTASLTEARATPSTQPVTVGQVSVHTE